MSIPERKGSDLNFSPPSHRFENPRNDRLLGIGSKRNFSPEAVGAVVTYAAVVAFGGGVIYWGARDRGRRRQQEIREAEEIAQRKEAAVSFVIDKAQAMARELSLNETEERRALLEEIDFIANEVGNDLALNGILKIYGEVYGAASQEKLSRVWDSEE